MVSDHSVRKLFLLVLLLTPRLFALDCKKDSANSQSSNYNQAILEAVQSMPAYGKYNSDDSLIANLKSSITTDSQNKIQVHPETAQPSFCSSATYLVFMKAISNLQSKGLKLSKEATDQLMVQAKPEHMDGTGAWGRWNADGPGTARLFKEVGLGENFTELGQAKPGDFVKIFWNDLIGNDPKNKQSEHGHSAVFEGTKSIGGVESFCFWSSNQSYKNDKGETVPGGMGHKCVPQSKIKRTLFSRLQNPERLNCVPETVGKLSSHYHDPYLTRLGSTLSTPEEMCKMTSCQPEFSTAKPQANQNKKSIK